MISGTSSSHEKRIGAPAAIRKTNTGTRFSARLNSATRTTDERDREAREVDLAHERLAHEQRADEPLVASAKKLNSTIPSSSACG